MKRKQIIIYVTMGILCFVGIMWGNKIVAFWNNILPAKYVEWKTFSAPEGQLEIKTPVELISLDLPLPDDAKEKMESLLSYSGSMGNYFAVFLTEVKYRPQVDIPLEASERGGVRQLKGNPDVSDLSFTQDSVIVSGYFVKRQLYF